ncbi:MAG: hypothetical protein DI586_09720 [Micavibrio aeruginosavorus]|uniref:Dipeptidylpeptidase IV N-terminal domain-containing protein n=1 Tax=Micavibrio aeruginosavorus TaxID=349221 RepID=A0A2W5FL41_9BACT|nr:MAG: hypothetical protein DI586_09720 [Micavibrio aeruginosavorus]
MRTGIKNISPHNDEPPIEIGYFDLSDKNPSFYPVTTSLSWNWQQGCRLQWFPNLDDHVIYNDYKNGKFISCLFNICQKEVVEEFHVPIYTLSPDGTYGLSLDFSQLHKFRPGYGYSNASIPSDSSTAVSHFDFTKREIQSLISYEMIRGIEELKKVDGHTYINHLSYSPDGKRFIFFFITFNQGTRRTYLMTAKSDGSGLSLLIPEMQPSHYAWKNSHEILITAKLPNGKIGYFIVNCDTQHYQKIENDHLSTDGHPSFINSQDFITDTYPDRTGHQHLFVQNLSGSNYNSVGHFYLPPSFFGERRCDLHPRLSPDKKTVCVDVIQNGRRSMAIIPLNE